MAPEEARKKAEDRRVIQEQPLQGQYPKKRGANQITPLQGPELKKRKFSYASVTGTQK